MTRLVHYSVLTGLLVGLLACWLTVVWAVRELLS